MGNQLLCCQNQYGNKLICVIRSREGWWIGGTDVMDREEKENPNPLPAKDLALGLLFFPSSLRLPSKLCLSHSWTEECVNQ